MLTIRIQERLKPANSSKRLAFSNRRLVPEAGGQRPTALCALGRKSVWKIVLAVSAKVHRLLPLPLREDWGERLSCLSSCIGELGTRIACFCIEANEQFAGERDADDHFFLSGGAQAVAEVTEAVIIARGNVSDEEQDRAHGAASAADRALALSLTTVVSDWGDADELGNGLVGVGADLGQVSHQPGHGTASDALHRAPGIGKLRPQRVVIDHGSDLSLKLAGLPLEQGNHLVEAGQY